MNPQNINLLTSTTEPKGKVETLLEWILVWGRGITLITIVFIIGVFGIRVWKDTERNDLKEEVDDAYDRVYQLDTEQRKYEKVQTILRQLSVIQTDQELISEQFFIYDEYLKQYEGNVEELQISYRQASFTVIFDNLEEMRTLEKKLDADERIDGNPAFNVDVSFEGSDESEVKAKIDVYFLVPEDNITQ